MKGRVIHPPRINPRLWGVAYINKHKQVDPNSKMNIAKSSRRKGFTLVELLVVIAIIVALAALATPQIFKALKRAALAEAVSNARQVKLALDTFATDFDGQFPNDDTGEGVVSGGTGTTYSNDYFRQLFLSGATESESIFWVKNSAVASKGAPDDKIKESGKMQAELILEQGDVHWAYINDQTNLSTGSRPLILDGYPKNEAEFDPDTWDNKVIVVRIDGAAKPMRMRVTDNKVLDGSNKDILSSSADAWDGESTQDILKQPEPRDK
ncbi:MAG: hypothetical protein CMP28_14845 [Roseibacillus sp.]|nr:hypothetical protein [Roseibacillus sp.]